MNNYQLKLKTRKNIPLEVDVRLSYCTAKTPNRDADRHLDCKRLPSVSDYTEDYKCPYCGRIFTVELPE